jgi:hypothetical protein
MFYNVYLFEYAFFIQVRIKKIKTISACTENTIFIIISQQKNYASHDTIQLNKKFTSRAAITLTYISLHIRGDWKYVHRTEV